MLARTIALILMTSTTACDRTPAASGDPAAPATGTATPTSAASPAPSPTAAAAPAPAPDPAASTVDFAALAGTWRVAGVAVGEGVQALSRDDPAYLGRELTISADRLAWAGAKGGAAVLDDVCEGPVTARQGGDAKAGYDREFGARLETLGVAGREPHAVECDTGSWGPQAAGGAIIYPAGPNTLAMSWYDGAMLKLVRAR